ncbi:MAG: LysM peptidoglycan-binding domain-containing protein, partial [Anaerolineales bacterium]|nr:LysM peptidoglycan-binding domain-containing protein [Anaerolineales bacterium]
MKWFPILIIIFISLLLLSGCERPDPTAEALIPTAEGLTPPTPSLNTNADGNPVPPTPILQRRSADSTPLPPYIGTPTPAPPHPVAESGSNFLLHTVSPGETLGYIAQQYGSSLDELLAANELAQADLLFVGQELRIPSDVLLPSSSFKIIPDSELVYGPSAAGFDVQAFA